MYSWSIPWQYKLCFFIRVLVPDQFLKTQAIQCRQTYESLALGWILMNFKFSNSLDKKKSWKEIKACRILITFSCLLFPYSYLNSTPLCNNRSLGCDFAVDVLTAWQSSKQKKNIFKPSIWTAMLRLSSLSCPLQSYSNYGGRKYISLQAKKLKLTQSNEVITAITTWCAVQESIYW